MARINNVDQILVLLQAHLERLEQRKKPGAGAPARTARATGSASAPLERLQALAATDALAEEDLARALVGALLSQEFGAELTLDITFQRVVDEVSKAIAADADASALMRRAIAQLVAG